MVYMLAESSVLVGLKLCWPPGSPGVRPACAQPILTLSLPKMSCVAANQMPFRCRSFWNSSTCGRLRCKYSYMPLKASPNGNVYCTPALNAVSLPMSVKYGGEAPAPKLVGNSADSAAKVAKSSAGELIDCR